MHKNCLNDILCFSLCKITKAPGVRASVTATDAAYFFCPRQKNADAFSRFQGVIFPSIRKFFFSKIESRRAPLGRGLYFYFA